MQDKKPTISGFFPYLNDWGTIGSLVATLDLSLKKITSDYEIIIIDDGSDFNSKRLLRTLRFRFPHLRVVAHKKNSGYGSAVRSGIDHAKMDWIFYTDGDAQYNPVEIVNLVKRISPKVDIINGYKIHRNDPWYRIVAGRTYHIFVRFLFNIPIRDTDCDFRLMRRSIFDTVILKESSGLICAEMIKKISDSGFKFIEVPVHHYWRTSGKSQFFNFRRVLSVVLGLLRLWYQLVLNRNLKNCDRKVAQLVKIHKQVLKKSFLNILGDNFLVFFYSVLITNDDILVQTVSNHNEIIGYSVTALNGGTLGQIVRNNFFIFSFIVIKVILKDFRLTAKILWGLINSQKEVKSPELLFIAVKDKFQGKGIGTALISNLNRNLRQHEFKYYQVATSVLDVAANDFYKKLGFLFIEKRTLFGEIFNYYKYELSATS